MESDSIFHKFDNEHNNAVDICNTHGDARGDLLFDVACEMGRGLLFGQSDSSPGGIEAGRQGVRL